MVPDTRGEPKDREPGDQAVPRDPHTPGDWSPGRGPAWADSETCARTRGSETEAKGDKDGYRTQERTGLREPLERQLLQRRGKGRMRGETDGCGTLHVSV
jgi:hypothetical protein